MNRIIFYSGGKASFVTAHWVKENHPKDNILLMFTDTNFEDEDLYRFIKETSTKLKLPMLWLNTGEDPLSLMEKDNFLYNSRIANCSYKLKVVPAKKFVKKGELTQKWHVENEEYLTQDVQDYRHDPVLYFGIGYQEAHRQHAIRKNWKPYQVDMPLIDEYIDPKEILALYNVKQPRLYDMGFSHNNCAGRCIKGGQGHWLQLYKKNRKKFNQMRDFEVEMNKSINEHHGTDKKYSFMKKRKEPYLLKDLEDDEKNRPEQIDMFDFGTCGCFINEE